MNESNFKGLTAVVTGASLGIGRATAIALGRAGANVVVNYRSHPEQAEEVVQAIRDAGGRAIRFQADVAEQAAVERMVEAAVSEYGRVDVAVSNAAYSDRELFFDADMAGFRRTVDVTMWGAFYLMRAATQHIFLTPDYEDRYPEARAELAALLRDGRLISREQIVEGGVRAFPELLPMVFSGASTGKLILAL